MTEDSQELWKSLCELDNNFSRLGGSARYANMSKSEIPLYVAARLMQRHIPSFEPKEFLDRRVMVGASPVLEKVQAHINAVNAEGEEIVNLIRGFIQPVGWVERTRETQQNMATVAGFWLRLYPA